MLLVFSNQANKSKHIGRELTLASKYEIPIIPVKIENVKPNEKFEYYLEDIQWYNAVVPPIEEHLSKVLKRVNEILEMMQYNINN